MKYIKLFLLALVPVSAPAAAPRLAALDCVASNGVVYRGREAGRGGFFVETRWGLLKRSFTATVAPGESAESFGLELAGEGGTEFRLVLNGSPYRISQQKLGGAVYQSSRIRGVPDAFLAFVSCDLRLRWR